MILSATMWICPFSDTEIFVLSFLISVILTCYEELLEEREDRDP